MNLINIRCLLRITWLMHAVNKARSTHNAEGRSDTYSRVPRLAKQKGKENRERANKSRRKKNVASERMCVCVYVKDQNHHDQIGRFLAFHISM